MTLKRNGDIRILPADKGNCTVVMKETTYMEKLNTLLDSDLTSRIERKILKLLSKHKSGLSVELKRHLTSRHSKPPHLCGLPKIHKENIALRPM
jgi:hypothetical protein